MLKFSTNETMSNALIDCNAEENGFLAHNRYVPPKPLEIEGT